MSKRKTLEKGELYTVGWIAALAKELAAALAMLDERHGAPDDFIKPSSDKNSYHWGRIGDHNIVIASLAAGIYGTTSAATTAIHMLSSFPNIKVGLMVGIGAAIARPKQKRDIRLGDVVVSLPQGQTGGVVQYDLGKSHTSRNPGDTSDTFERVGFLNSPPEALLKALTSLRAQVRIEGSRVSSFLEDMLERYPQMAESEPDEPGYIYQGQENDRLYAASYLHTSDMGCDDCDPARMISRAARRNPDVPRVHYGMIASGNRLVKDAAERDRILEMSGGDCMCLEMEAAGLMNSFPCLVVRGICDYADSHKNDDWQEYAAASAAAYAKEFLGFVENGDLARTSKASEILKQISEDLREMNVNVKVAGEAVQGLQLDYHQEQIRDWLSAPDPSTNYVNALDKRHKGTGLWFTQGETFRRWKGQPDSFLWLHGMAGCGKTILSSTIIEHLQSDTKPDQPLLYFYFDFKDSNKQTLENMLRSLTKQLYQGQPKARGPLEQLWESQRNSSRQLSKQSLSATLLAMLSKTNNTSIVLDALDEASTRSDLLAWLESVHGSNCSVRILVTARREENIESALQNWTQPENIISIIQYDVDKDIRSYVTHRVRNSGELERWQNRRDVQDEIESELVEKADGMFRWVACQIDALKDCLDYPRLQRALRDLPKDLDDTYARILERIPREQMDQATTILNLLVWQDRILTVNALMDAVAVDLDHEPGFHPKNRMPVPREILKLCSSLITVHWDRGEEEDIVQLAHFSVKEYLTSDHVSKAYENLADGRVARAYLARLCLTYIIGVSQLIPVWIDENQDMFHQDDRSYQWGYGQAYCWDFTFARYSCQYWMDHARGIEIEDGRLWKLMTTFFLERPEALLFAASVTPFWLDLRKPSDLDPISYACCGGLMHVVKYLIDKGTECAEANATTTHGHLERALPAAASQGHDAIVQVLLDKGVDVNARHGAALCLASQNGHDTTVQLLFNKGADVKAGNDAALWLASGGGHDTIVQFLLDKGADVDAGNGAALCSASRYVHDKTVRLLLDRGADVNAGNGAALQTASSTLRTDIVQLLLDRGADVNARNGAALCSALQNRCEKNAQLLIDRGADVNAQNGVALLCAVRDGDNTTVERLIDRGADMSARDENGDNALMVASSLYCYWKEKLSTETNDSSAGPKEHFRYQHRRAEDTLLVMLQHLTTELAAKQNSRGMNMLHYAAACGLESIVQKCLDLGVDIHARDNNGKTALHFAAVALHFTIVKVLVRAGLNAEVLKEDGWTLIASTDEVLPEVSRARSSDRGWERSRERSPDLIDWIITKIGVWPVRRVERRYSS